MFSRNHNPIALTRTILGPYACITRQPKLIGQSSTRGRRPRDPAKQMLVFSLADGFFPDRAPDAVTMRRVATNTGAVYVVVVVESAGAQVRVVMSLQDQAVGAYFETLRGSKMLLAAFTNDHAPLFMTTGVMRAEYIDEITARRGNVLENRWLAMADAANVAGAVSKRDFLPSVVKPDHKVSAVAVRLLVPSEQEVGGVSPSIH